MLHSPGRVFAFWASIISNYRHLEVGCPFLRTVSVGNIMIKILVRLAHTRAHSVRDKPWVCETNRECEREGERLFPQHPNLPPRHWFPQDLSRRHHHSNRRQGIPWGHDNNFRELQSVFCVPATGTCMYAGRHTQCTHARTHTHTHTIHKSDRIMALEWPYNGLAMALQRPWHYS